MIKQFKISASEIKKLIDIKGSCIASDRITVDGRLVGYMYRESSTNVSDTGWRFFAGDEDASYTSNANNFGIYELNTICNYDNSIIPYLNRPKGTKLEREGQAFIEVNE